MALGIVTTLVSFVLSGIGLIAIPIVYLVMTRRFSVFARALGWTYIVSIGALAGAFCICMIVLSAYNR
jgi:hypothetical protein